MKTRERLLKQWIKISSEKTALAKKFNKYIFRRKKLIRHILQRRGFYYVHIHCFFRASGCTKNILPLHCLFDRLVKIPRVLLAEMLRKAFFGTALTPFYCRLYEVLVTLSYFCGVETFPAVMAVNEHKKHNCSITAVLFTALGA